MVGGSFTTPSNALARFNSDGTPDTTFNTNIGNTVTDTVSAVTLDSNDKIVVAGYSTTPNNYLARFFGGATPSASSNAWRIVVAPICSRWEVRRRQLRRSKLGRSGPSGTGLARH